MNIPFYQIKTLVFLAQRHQEHVNPVLQQANAESANHLEHKWSQINQILLELNATLAIFQDVFSVLKTLNAKLVKTE